MRMPILLTAALVVTAALAIEPPKDRPAAPPPDQPADATAPAADVPAAPAAADEPEELPPLPPDVVDAGPPPQRFTPTEKVRADFPVSYPIDI